MALEDAIEKIIGKFGPYQIWIYALIMVGRLPADFHLTNVVFVIPSVDYVCMDANAYNVSNHCPCEDVVYDQSTIVSSVTSEWNLICSRKWLASLTQSMLQIGILVGSLLFGYISDRYGRRPAVLLALFSTAFFGLISAVVPNLWMFMAARLLTGTAVGGTMLCYYVLLIELSGKSFRSYMVGLLEVSYVFSYFIQPIIAMYVRNWRHLVLVTSAPWILVAGYYWLLPESPRWLITVGKKREAIDTLTLIAKRNKRSTDNIEAMVEEIEMESKVKDEQRHGSYLDLFQTAKIRTYTVINAFVWMFAAHTFFGVNQFIGQLQGNLYVNIMLSAACLAPGMIVVVIATLIFKRKVSVIISMCVAAVSLFVFIFIPSGMQTVTLVFAIIGQIGAYTSYIQMFLYSSEIFPTVIRNSALGFASVFGGFGSIIAPFVVNIGIEWISILIFSSLAFLAAIFCLFLPETKHIVLMNSIEQINK